MKSEDSVQENSPFLGTHIIVDYRDLPDSYFLNDPNFFIEHMSAACELAGATVLRTDFRTFGEGHGYTAIIMLAESHASIHTWPEHGMATMDIFMCGNANPSKALQYFDEKIPQAEQVDYSQIGRGFLST